MKLLCRSSWALAVLLVAAVCLHAYECFVLAAEPSPGFFAWLLLPYLVAILFITRGASPVPAIAGACVALAVDGFQHYSVFISPGSSTAALGMLFVPLWSALVFVPLGGFFAKAALRRRMTKAA